MHHNRQSAHIPSLCNKDFKGTDCVGHKNECVIYKVIHLNASFLQETKYMNNCSKLRYPDLNLTKHGLKLFNKTRIVKKTNSYGHKS